MISRTILFLAAMVAVATAFSPTEPPTRSRSTYKQMKRVGLATPPPSFSRSRCNNGICMSVSDAEAEAAKLREQAAKLREEVDAAKAAIPASADGTVYDDEPMLEPERENVSNAMKERLRREASSGLDSESGNTNVILYISVAVVLLVALGGQGILF